MKGNWAREKSECINMLDHMHRITDGTHTPTDEVKGKSESFNSPALRTAGQ